MLKLYDYFRSSASFRVRIALNLKGLPYEVIPIHLINNGGEQYAPSYTAINPQNLVPTLIDDHQPLTQSLAIIEYINELYPMPPLLPADPYQKALVRAFALTIAADIHPLNNLRILTYLTNGLSVSEENKNAWYHHWLNKGLTALEAQLVTTGKNGVYSFGDSPTLADICLVPQLCNAKRFNCDLTPYPTLMQIDAHCLTQSAFTDAWPHDIKMEIS